MSWLFDSSPWVQVPVLLALALPVSAVVAAALVWAVDAVARLFRRK